MSGSKNSKDDNEVEASADDTADDAIESTDSTEAVDDETTDDPDSSDAASDPEVEDANDGGGDTEPEHVEASDEKVEDADSNDQEVNEERATDTETIETEVEANGDGAQNPQETHSEADVSPRPPEAPQRARGGFVPLVLGGVAAGVIGFFAGQYGELFSSPEEGPTPSDNAALLEAQAERIESLEAALTDVSERDISGEIGAAIAPVDARIEETATAFMGRIDDVAGELEGVSLGLGALTEQVGPLEFGSVLEQFDTISTDLAGLSEKVEVLALRPIATGMDVDAFDGALSQFRTDLRAALDQAQAEIEEAREAAARISEEAIRVEQAALSDFRGELQSAVDEVQSEIDQARETAAKISEEAFAAEAEAQRAEQSAQAMAAVGQITAALEDGSSYSDALGNAEAVLDVEIPAVISENAASGVASVAMLQETFPDAARAALNSAIRADSGEGAMDRLTAFIRVQSGARSLAPREGDDPDAVLSRAEAALRSGDVAAAVSEIDTLPEDGRAAMAVWRGAAEARVSALSAAADLAQTLQQN